MGIAVAQDPAPHQGHEDAAPASPVAYQSDVDLTRPADSMVDIPRGPDPSAAAAGQAAFERSCTSCHDAQRALGKAKGYSAWLGTVRRMAGKEGADVRSSEIEPIAAYLATVAGVAASSGGGEAEAAEAGGWSFGATISTLHRSASDAAPLENPGFFADVWATAEYQSSGPWRANITACTSCHSSNTSVNGYSLELMEGSATLDLRHAICGTRCNDDREVLVKAGRFITPFGAIAARAHPGVSRTVTNPLMFNMGRRVFVPGSSPPLQPVLPAPFSDEGIDLMVRSPVFGEVNFTLDLYATNGLQGTTSSIFARSRSYVDNNEEPSAGYRMTLGSDWFRIGTSLLQGNLQDQGLTGVDYRLVGADATGQITQRLRAYFEYAVRTQDSVFTPGLEEHTYGIVTELEYQLFEQPGISALVRFDTLEHRNQILPDATLQRFTWGLNWTLPGGSLLMLNHERWMPLANPAVDVVGIRWTVSL